MKPYKFQPYLKTTIWGGYQIAPFKGIYTAQPNIGESWEISGVPGHESVAVERGLVDDVDIGMNLTQLIDKYKGLLIGDKVYKKLMAVKKPSAEDLQNYGYCCWFLGKVDEAADCFRKYQSMLGPKDSLLSLFDTAFLKERGISDTQIKLMEALVSS